MHTPSAAPDVRGTARHGTTARNAAGAALAVVLGAWQTAGSAGLTDAAPPGSSGLPPAVLVLAAALGLVEVGAGGLALVRRSRGPLRVAAGALLLSLLVTVPAFLVEDVPLAQVLRAALAVGLGLAAVVLLTGRR